MHAVKTEVEVFGFDDNRNLCIHDGVCVYVGVYVCVCLWRLACKHDISRREAWTDLIIGM